MYVRGMGAVAPRNAGFQRPGTVVLRIPLNLTRRGVRGMGLTCPPGQSPTNMYDGSVKCCGGSTQQDDPCSYENTNAGYIATQAQAQADAIAGDAGNNSAMLAQLAGYPQNVQNDAIECYSNPGATFVDSMGKTINCPSAGVQNLSGGSTSIYTFQQLAAMLAGSATPANETPSNVAGTSVSLCPPNADCSGPVPVPKAAPVVIPIPGAASTTSPTPAVAPMTASGGTDIGTQISTALTNTVAVGGVSLPVWGLAAAGLALVWFMGGKH